MSMAEMVRMIEAAVADLGSCTEGELVEALTACERVRSTMAAHAAALTAACDHRQVWAADGAATPGGWVAQVCDQPRSVGQRLVRQARRLEQMPVTAAAFAGGEIGEAKVSLLVAARTERLAEEFDRCEPTLVDAAKSLTCDDLAKVLERWRHVARDALQDGEAGVERGDDPQSRPSEIHLSSTMDGRWLLSGDLTFEDGAILAHGIDVANRSLFHRGARLSDGARFEPAERRAVGLIETFKRGITEDPERVSAQPLLLGVVDLELLTRRAERERLRCGASGGSPPSRGDAAGGVHPPDLDVEERSGLRTRVAELVAIRCAHRGEPPPPRWRPRADLPRRRTARDAPDPFDLAGLDLMPAPDPTDPFDLGRCEIAGAGPIPVEMAQRLACNGRIARVVLGADSDVLDKGRAVRTATPDQRHALIARDGGCVFPGCDRPPGWWEAHHLDFWDDDDGPTDLDNLALTCSHHHHLVHEHHWTLERTSTGWLAQSPTGKRLHRAVPI